MCGLVCRPGASKVTIGQSASSTSLFLIYVLLAVSHAFIKASVEYIWGNSDPCKNTNHALIRFGE